MLPRSGAKQDSGLADFMDVFCALRRAYAWVSKLQMRKYKDVILSVQVLCQKDWPIVLCHL